MKKPLRNLLIILSVLGLVLTVGPSFLVFSGKISLYMDKVLMFIGTVLWFTLAPFWIGKKAV